MWYNTDMNDNQDDITRLKALNQDELKVVVDCVFKPEQSSRYAEKFNVTLETFTDSVCCSAWDALISLKTGDLGQRQKALRNALSLSTDQRTIDYIDNYIAMTPGEVELRLHRFACGGYERKIKAIPADVFREFGNTSDSSILADEITKRVNAVPKVPSCGCTEAEIDAEKNGRGENELPEIPPRCLHMPGFVDEVTEYSMDTAYKPNRTLSFAGALALLAHLAGRKFTDGRDTRTNLFVLAVADTGAGKEHPRKVNRKLLNEFCIAGTAFDSVASGEGIEEILFSCPSALLQIDEFQKLLQSIGNKQNQQAHSIAGSLLKLYTSSGSSYTMRVRATKPDQIGRVIDDPSLSVFGTGVGHGVYKALTLENIEEGLVGRCLIFDTEIEGEDNDFTNKPKEIPQNIIAFGQQLVAMDCWKNRIVVSYADGVNERLNAILKEIREKKSKCKSDSNFAGVAIWGRAAEKVSKLALLYAISGGVSEKFEQIVISKEAVEWAWELVQVLIKRMIFRIDTWMTEGDVQELSRRIVDYLKRQKNHSASRRDVQRSVKPKDMKQLEDAEAYLVGQGDIEVRQEAKRSKRYILIPRTKKEEV